MGEWAKIRNHASNHTSSDRPGLPIFFVCMLTIMGRPGNEVMSHIHPRKPHDHSYSDSFHLFNNCDFPEMYCIGDFNLVNSDADNIKVH